MKIIFRNWDFGNTHNHVGQHVLSSGQREEFVIPRKLCDARTLCPLWKETCRVRKSRMNIIYLPSSTTPKQWGRGNFLKNTGPFPQKWKNPVMVTLNFPTLVKYTLYMRWFMIFTDRCPLPSLGGEDLPKGHSFASLLHKRDSQYSAHKKQLKRRWGRYFFLYLPLAAIFWQLPTQVLMSQMLSKRLEVNVIASQCELFKYPTT